MININNSLLDEEVVNLRKRVNKLEKELKSLKKEVILIIWAAARSNGGTLQIDKLYLVAGPAFDDIKIEKYEDIRTDKVIFKAI